MKNKSMHCLIILLMVANSIVAQDTWTQKANFGGGNRVGTIHFSIGDKGYVGTGYNDASIATSDFWEFNPATGVWTQKADYGGGVRIYATSFSVGNKGYAGTGSVGSYDWRKDMWEYAPSSNTWRQIADFAGGFRYAMVGFGIGNKGYMGTGNYRESPWVLATYYNDFWEYDPATDRWTQKRNVPEEGRCVAIGMSIGNKGYIGTGFYYYDTRKKDFWEYDPSADTWTRKADFAGTERYAAAAFTIGNKGYVGTGWNNSAFNDLWEYNPSTDSWLQKASLPGDVRYSSVSFGIGNKGYIGMGSNGVGSPLNDFWEYNPGSAIINCPPTQTLCFTSTNTYTIPSLIATSNCGIQSISYTITGATNRSGTGADASGTFTAGTSSITWTVVDNNGNNNSCTTTVIVDNPLSVSIADVFAVNPGGMVNTLYIGYGPTSLTLTATGSGGYLAPGHSYTYAWSTGATTAFISISPSAPGTYNYTVTITDEYGCTASISKTITVVDVRCGNKLDKVIVCQVPPGNPANRHEICVSKNAVAAHLKNGSYLGSCQPNSISGGNTSMNPAISTPDEKLIRVNPNPNNGSFTLQLNNLNAGEIRVLDQTGKVVYRTLVNQSMKSQTITMNLGTIAKGVYTIQAIGKEGITTTKMMIQ